MTRAFAARSSAVLLALAVLAAPPRAWSQRTMAGVRGVVLDDKGQPVPDVKVDMEFLGESRQKVTRTQQTDKKGGFVRMGVPDGKWKFTFSKPGHKTYMMEMELSLGGFSEAGEIVLKPEEPVVVAADPAQPVAAVLPPTPESNKAGQTYTKAVEAAQAGRYDEAEVALKEVLAQFPDLAAAHYNLAFVYQRKKDWAAAEAAYKRVTELEPGKSDSFIALAAVRELGGRGPEATEGLLAAAPAFEQDALFQYALGMTASNTGRTVEAEKAFKKAAALNPAHPEPLFQLATIAVGQNKVADAVALLEKYLAMTGQVPANVETAKALLAALKKK